MADSSKTRLVNEFPTRLSFLTTRGAIVMHYNRRCRRIEFGCILLAYGLAGRSSVRLTPIEYIAMSEHTI